MQATTEAESEGAKRVTEATDDGGDQSANTFCGVTLNPKAEDGVGNGEEEHDGGHDSIHGALGGLVIQSEGRRASESNGQEADRPTEPPVATITPNEASKAPLRAASMDPHAPKAATVVGGTRQGRWPYRNQTKCRFCGGKLCLRCSEQCALRCKGAAIHGLHSHWITDSIIGMQRPSTRLIKAYDIVDQFRRKGVTAIFNLTEPGEHPHCGDGLEKMSGFPYLPETFMREGISVYNFAWEDMTTPSMALLTDIVRVAVSCVQTGGKIAVHCHAGYGRTGLVIASVIVMMKNLPPQQAVALVRDKRPTSVQTSAQVSIVGKFADFVRGVRVVYHLTDHARVTLGQHLTQQAFLLHGQESVNLRWLPKPVALATRMLVALAREKPGAVVLALAGVENSSGSDHCEGSYTNEGFPTWGMAEEQCIKVMQYASNANDWGPWDHLAEECDARPASVDPRLPAQLLYDWLAQLAAPPITVTELRRVLPQSAIAAALPDEDQEPTAISTSSLDTCPEGEFYRLNLLPVGQVRLVQCLTDCLRGVRNALAAAGVPQGSLFQKACLRVAISMVHLSAVHEGLLLGRNIAHGVIQDLINKETAEDGKGGQHEEHEHTSTTLQYTTGYTASLYTDNSADTFSSWGAHDDTDLPRTSPPPDISSSTVKRRSLSSSNIKQGLENVPPFDVIRPLGDQIKNQEQNNEQWMETTLRDAR